METENGEHAIIVTVGRLDERLKAANELAEERRNTDAKALEIVAKEMERRLDNLNNEAVRIARIQGVSVSREMFDEWRAGQDRRWEAINTKIAYAAGAAAAIAVGVELALRLFLK